MWSGKDLHFLQSERLPVLRGSHRRHAWLILGGNKANIAVCQTRKRARHQRAASRSLSFTLSLSHSLCGELHEAAGWLSGLRSRVCELQNTAWPWCQSTFTAYYSNQSKHAHKHRRTLISSIHEIKMDYLLVWSYCAQFIKTLLSTFSPVEHDEIIGHITEVKRIANEVYDFWLAFSNETQE